MDLHTVPIIRHEFCARDVGEETVILSPAGDQVLSLNTVGSFIWKQLDGQHNLRDLVDILCDEYEVEPGQAQADLVEFIQQLVDHELVTLQTDPEPAP